MARFQRGNEVLDLWLREPDGERERPWPVLYSAAPGEVPHPVALDHQWQAERQFGDRQLELLATGWRRVHDPVREADVDGEPNDLELDAAIRDGDDGALLVYADWLQQRGHPRGALIAVQHARETRSDDANLAYEEQKLFINHRDELLGPLAELVREPGAPRSDGGLELDWHRGFITRARIDGFPSGRDSEQRLWEVLRHPSARFLRTLELGCHQPGDQDNRLAASLIARGGIYPPLRRLVLADFDYTDIDNIDISRARIGDLSGLGERYPQLEDVFLKGNYDLELERLDLPRARRFVLQTSTLRRTVLAQIAGAAWPALEELELWVGDSEYGGDCQLVDLVPLFARGKLPALRRLRLMNTLLSDELVPLVADAEFASQLELLDFSLGTLSDEGAAQLARARARFPQLQTLCVFQCSLSRAGLDLLRAFPVTERPLLPAESWRDEFQKRRRYISVTE